MKQKEGWYMPEFIPPRLTAVERQVLSMRLWHPDLRSGFTLEELSFVFEMSKERVRALQDSALRKLSAAPSKLKDDTRLGLLDDNRTTE